MTQDEYSSRAEAIIASYTETYRMTKQQVSNACDNQDTFGYPDDEFSERCLEALEACLGGEAANNGN
tara:strand:- start:1289 stop:1489 length:201 start_codon:yes stop_codon:yes gene_type:complete